MPDPPGGKSAVDDEKLMIRRPQPAARPAHVIVIAPIYAIGSETVCFVTESAKCEDAFATAG